MSELITKLGIDWKLLLAQIVNFLVLLFVLYRFAYKPILEMLEKRTRKIEKGLKDANEAHRKLEESADMQKEILKKARSEAKEIVEKANLRAEKGKADIAAEAKVQAEKILVDAKRQINQKKDKMFAEVKAEIGQLVVAATEKVVGEKLNAEKDRTLIEKSLR